MKENILPANIFEPFQLGDLVLANRMVLAPMTRNRADAEGLVLPMTVNYYQQRATAGLIVTESVPVSPEGVGYPFTPGIYTEAQATSWLNVTDAVHATGGHIFVQLQHCGRISHPSLQPNNATPVSPSALRPQGQAVTYTGMQDFIIPRALEIDEIPDIVMQFRCGAEMAKHAGFDGIEVHGANGYIIDQFLRDGSNQRSDAYGGSVQNRMRLLNEILDAICEVWPAQRIGVRLSPENGFNSMSDSNPQAHFGFFAEQLSPRGLAYIHMLEGDMMTRTSMLEYPRLRSQFAGTYIANNGYDLVRAQTALRSNAADMVAFGVPFLANPDLVCRYRESQPLNIADPSTFYGGDDVGYTDYPFYNIKDA
ncbi:MAG: alkene reductase [Burkholderiales bacterium]|nr:alkene reductase [Burkholderiales bacterium]